MAVGAGSVHASVYQEETVEQTRLLVVDPFSTQAMETLGRINQAGISVARSGTPIRSIDNIIERKTFEDPKFGTSFWIYRTITFDLGSVIQQVNSALEPYRKDGCSKFKISSPALLSLEPHKIRLGVDMSYKKRACDNILGTHNISSGHGSAIIVGRLIDVNGGPQIKFDTENINIDTDTVLGIDADSMFGRIVRILTVELAKLLGSLNPIRGTFGELQLRLLRPISQLAETESIAAAQAQYTATEIAEIVRGYGSLSKFLRNEDAEALQFTLADSGMARRPKYRLRDQFSGQKDSKLCDELGAGGLREYYCSPTGEASLVLKVVQKTFRVEDSRALLMSHFRREAVYLSSLSDQTVIKFYPSHVQRTRIVDENYIDRLFGRFFSDNNAKTLCARDFSPGRPLSTGVTFCGYRIVPAWQRIIRPDAVATLEPGLPLGVEDFDEKVRCGNLRSEVDSRCVANK
jgi:hypothetical protein